ncbi:MAG: hypothetical protein NTV34_03395 [Proteobacteria bacterium]|nr:hypothetical protein [Pseudomonadota bacterium]
MTKAIRTTRAPGVPVIRLATIQDALAITILYHRVYGGLYSNQLMRDTLLLEAFLKNAANVWVIAEQLDEASGDASSDASVEVPVKARVSMRVVGSVAYETDSQHRLSRAFGGVVMSEFRGAGILEKAMIFAQSHLMDKTLAVDVVYATTRTSSPAPQIVTEHLGFKKLGIFPNVHKTDVFETHCLTAFFSQEALWARFTQFRLHPRIASLFDAVRSECTLPEIPEATPEDLELDAYSRSIALELVQAEKYANHRFQLQRETGVLKAHFYPFHVPNMVVTSPCQTVEIFMFVAATDKHCTIMGVKKPREIDFTELLDQTVRLLNGIGVRYIEILVRADKCKTLERVMGARFIPCAYFPAFQLVGASRYDFVVLSRTFEILDFTNVRLTGKNRLFLEEYIRNIQEFFLKPRPIEPGYT